MRDVINKARVSIHVEQGTTTTTTLITYVTCMCVYMYVLGRELHSER